MKRKNLNIIIGLFLVVGLLVLFYPTVSNWYNTRHHDAAIVGYDDTIKTMTDEKIQGELSRARDYNAALTGKGITDPFIPGGEAILPKDYTTILNTNNGIMGYLRIPKINVDLPIYHGTSTEVLEKGVGHMEMTAFPIGGAGDHSVLTGHSGLPSAMLLTDLEKLDIGDAFYITTYKETLAYRVDQVLVVEPNNTKPLVPVAGEDYVTLITCTPYGVNSHRLLVRGTRVPYTEAEQQEFEGQGGKSPIHYDSIIAFVALFAVVITLLVVFVTRPRRGQNNRRPQPPKNASGGRNRYRQNGRRSP